jgi:flavin reductase (DIM6/NTAB) family NADH-FMN oxidoreductase RutF
VGIASGNKVADKFSRAGFTARKSEFVDAPVIEELPMALECELVSYDIESNHMVGRIVNVSVDESVLGGDGNVDADLLQPIVYDPVRLEYRVLGEKVGKAFSDGKKLL